MCTRCSFQSHTASILKRSINRFFATHFGSQLGSVRRPTHFTAPQHLVCRVVPSLHINHMQMSIIEVFICRRLHMNTSMILICIWLICRLGTTLHAKCCGAVFDMEPFVTVFTLNHISICVWHQTCAININFLSADLLWYLALFIKNRKWGKFLFSKAFHKVMSHLQLIKLQT